MKVRDANFLLEKDFEVPVSSDDFERLGRILYEIGSRNGEDQDSRGWNKLYRKCMTVFTAFKRNQ